MSSKINVGRLVLAHVRTMKNYGSGRYRPADFLTFYALPALAASCVLWLRGPAGKETATAVATSAPLAALVLASLVGTVYRIAHRVYRESSSRKVERHFTAELVTNIFYAILISVIATTAAVISLAAGGVVKLAADFSLYAASLHLLLTVMMVVSRARALICKYCRDEEEPLERGHDAG